MTTSSDEGISPSRRARPSGGWTTAPDQPDALLAAGRALLYPGLALTSLLLVRGPAELPVGDILVAMAGLLGALSLARRTLRLPGSILVAGGLAGAGALLASVVSSDPLGSAAVGVRVVYLVVVVPWVLLTLLTEQRHVVRAVLWLVGGAALCAAGALAQVVLGDIITGGEITGDNRLTGFTGHVSDLGGITAMGVGAALGAVFSPLPKRHRRVAGAVLALSALGLMLSGSVSGMLTVLAVVLFLGVRQALRFRRAVILGALGTGAGMFALSVLAEAGARNPVERLLVTTGETSVGGESNTAGSRFELTVRAVQGITERPLTGHGLVPADNILLRTLSVHNNFLAAWHSGGILLFAGVVIASAIAVRYCLARDLSDPLCTTVAGATVAAMVFAQTAPSFYNRYYWLPIAFAVVLTVRARASAPARSRPIPGSARLAFPGGRASCSRR